MISGSRPCGGAGSPTSMISGPGAQPTAAGPPPGAANVTLTTSGAETNSGGGAAKPGSARRTPARPARRNRGGGDGPTRPARRPRGREGGTLAARWAKTIGDGPSRQSAAAAAEATGAATAPQSTQPAKTLMTQLPATSLPDVDLKHFLTEREAPCILSPTNRNAAVCKRRRRRPARDGRPATQARFRA